MICFEYVGDHCTNIAEWVEFCETISLSDITLRFQWVTPCRFKSCYLHHIVASILLLATMFV